MKDLGKVIEYKAKRLAASGGQAPYNVHVEINVDLAGRTAPCVQSGQWDDFVANGLVTV